MCRMCEMTPEEIRAEQDTFKELYGWGACAIDGDPVGWYYTYGFARQGKPEIVMYGLPPMMAHQIVQSAVARMEHGEAMEPGTLVEDLITNNYKVAVVEVEDVQDPKYPLHYAQEHAEGHEVRAIQLVWPNEDGTYPWNADQDGVDGVIHYPQRVFGTWQPKEVTA